MGPRVAASLGQLVAAVAMSLWAGGAEAAEQGPLWLAVARPDLAEPLKPLAEKRRNDGFEARVVTVGIEEALAQSPRRPDCLLLVGDDEPGKEAAPWYLPAKRRRFYRWIRYQPPEFASDAAWGDVDEKGGGTIPVGRIPARTREQVDVVVRKILAFEARPPAPADLNATLWFGSPQYNAGMDAVATRLGVVMVQANGPPWLSPWFISGNRSDPLSGWPDSQAANFSRQMRQGGLLHVLMGHARPEAFTSMRIGWREVNYTATDAARALGAGPPVAPMVFITCRAGNFTRAEPCLAEALLFLPGGPVATIAATTWSHPLPNYFTSACLLRALGGGERRLGALWLRAQRDARAARDPIMEMTLRDVEGKLEKEINVEKLRSDQSYMYALLGDPATLLRLPEPLEASVERTATGWRWRAKRPSGATRLEVAWRKPFAFTMPMGAPPAGEKQANEALKAANAPYAFAVQPSPADGAAWEGTCERPGSLRLVAVGPKSLHVAVLKLE